MILSGRSLNYNESKEDSERIVSKSETNDSNRNIRKIFDDAKYLTSILDQVTSVKIFFYLEVNNPTIKTESLYIPGRRDL